MDARRRKSIQTEAVARITWGDAPDDVRAWLISQQMADDDADQLLRDCLRRRAREMRELGVRDLLLGCAAVIGASAVFAIGLALQSTGTLGTAILIGAGGCWKVWRGLDRMVFGARADGAVSDVE